MADNGPRRRPPRDYDDRPGESTRRFQHVEQRRPEPRTVEHEYVERDVIYDSEAHRRASIYSKISNIVWFFVGLLLTVIGIRVLLRLLNANESNEFVTFIYEISWFFVRPFQGIVNEPGADGAVLEINSLIAMLIYLVITWALLRLTWVILDVTAPPEA